MTGEELLEQVGEAAMQASYEHHCATDGAPLHTDDRLRARDKAVGRATLGPVVEWLRAPQHTAGVGPCPCAYCVHRRSLADELAALRREGA